jgi:hypothetical protein
MVRATLTRILGNRVKEGSSSFLKKRTKKLLFLGRAQRSPRVSDRRPAQGYKNGTALRWHGLGPR